MTGSSRRGCVVAVSLSSSTSHHEYLGNAVAELVEDVGGCTIFALLSDLVVIYAEGDRYDAYAVDLDLIARALSDQHAVFGAFIHQQR